MIGMDHDIITPNIDIDIACYNISSVQEFTLVLHGLLSWKDFVGEKEALVMGSGRFKTQFHPIPLYLSKYASGIS